MLISCDYETFLISDGNIFPKPVCLSYYDGKETGLLNRIEAEQYLSQKLTTNCDIIAHNAVFECGVTITHYPNLADLVFDALDSGRIHCTKINEALWNIQREKPLNKLDLASLVLYYFGVDISASKGEDAWRLRYSELDSVAIKDWPVEASQYAIDDSIWVYKIKEKQKPIDQMLALKSAVYLNLMGAQGFQIDNSRVLLLEKEIWEFLTPRYDFLVQQGFCDYIVRQKQPRKQVKKLKAYVESLGVDLMYSDKGAVSTKGEALAAYLTQIEDPVLRAFSELTRYEKILTSYINNLKSANPKIYTQYSTTKKTSRTSSSASKLFPSVNEQQIPRAVEDVTYDVRGCFVPRPGFKVCSIDYGALEIRAVAHQLYTLLGYSKLRDLLNSGDKPVDPHSVLAARMKGIEYYDGFKNDYKTDRDKVKETSLGLPGGMGYDTIRTTMWKKGIKTKYRVLEKAKRKSDLYYYMTNLSCPDLRIKRLGKYEYALVQDEIVPLKRYIFDLYPELEEFLKETHKKFQTGKMKWTKNDFGEWEEEPMHMYDTHGFKRDWCTYTALCNGFLMQTPSAMGAQKAVNAVYRHFYNSPDIIPQIFVHDELIFEVREDRTDLTAEAADIMMVEMQLELPSVRIVAEENWTDYWQKADGFYTQSYWKDVK